MNKKRGFSLAETVVVVGVFTLILTVLTTFIQTFYQQNSYAIQQSTAVETARRGVTKLVQDLREAVPSQGGAYPIESAADDGLVFFSDIDRDDLVEKAYYYINVEGQLVKEITEPSGEPAEYAGTPTSTEIVSSYIVNDLFSTDLFTFFDDAGAEVVDLDDVDTIRFVEVNLVVNVDPNRAPEEFVLHSSAYLRNLEPTLQ